MVWIETWLPDGVERAKYNRKLMWAAALGTLGFGGYMMYINQQQSPMLAKEKVPGALDHHKQGPRPVEATHRAITDVTGEKGSATIPPAV